MSEETQNPASLTAPAPVPVSENLLLPLLERFFSQQPHAAAQNLESMGRPEAASLLTHLSLSVAREVNRHLNPEVACELFQLMPTERMQEIAGSFEPEQAADYFMRLPNELRKPYLRAFSTTKRKQIREFLSYPEDSAGRIMSRSYTSFKATTKIGDVVRKIRRLRRTQAPMSYLYVVDDKKRLVGIVNVLDLLVGDDAAALDSIMRGEVFSVNCFLDRETVANEVKERRYLMVPVVDGEQRLLGVVRAEHLIEDVQQEASEDIQKMFGGGGNETAFSPVSFSLRQRLPWLHGNLATAFLAAAVVGFFEDIIARITVLAIFLPVVAGQGGNAGAQSLAVVMRGLVMREIPRARYGRLLVKEAVVGLINGVVIGFVTGLIAWVWQGNAYLGVVIGLGMIVNLIVAGLAGAGIPLLLKALGLDPAQSSNIILTTITDVVGFFAFLGFAVIFQAQLMPGG